MGVAFFVDVRLFYEQHWFPVREKTFDIFFIKLYHFSTRLGC